MCKWRSIGQLALLLALTIWAPADAFAQRREKLQIVSVSRGQPAKINVELLLPDAAAAKIPAMIIVHGSGGVDAQREYAYAQEFLKMNVAAAVIDSFGGRGIGATVRNQDAVSTHDMLVDAANTLTALAHHQGIDPDRIGIIGFSKGGTVVTKAALLRYVEPLTKNAARFSLLIALYPWCGDFPLDLRASDAPVYLLLGSDDNYVGTASCLEYGNRVKELGGNIVAKTYARAKHGWDVAGPTAWSDSKGQNHSKCVYDEIARGTWVERGSKIKIMENNKPTGNSAKARAHCMTLGVSGGYSSQAHAQSLQDIRNFMREAFRLQ
jgi:dienelactone hydrolase